MLEIVLSNNLPFKGLGVSCKILTFTKEPIGISEIFTDRVATLTVGAMCAADDSHNKIFPTAVQVKFEVPTFV